MGSSGTGGPQGFRIYCLGCLSCRYLTGRFLSRIRCFPLFLITTDPGLRLSRMTATGNDRPQKFPLSFPRAVVWNLLCPWARSFATKDPRQKHSGMTAISNNISKTTPRRLTFQDDGKKDKEKTPRGFIPPG